MTMTMVDVDTISISPPGYTSRSSTTVTTGTSTNAITAHRAAVEAEDPPDYDTARLPVDPISYSFSTISPTSMLLIPPASAPDSRPRYHISVSTNCFTPTSHITTVHRGASQNGAVVGEFEMGATSKAKPATIYVHGEESYIKDVLGESSTSRIVNWKATSGSLFWNGSGPSRKCFRSQNCRQHEILAEFDAPVALRRPGEPARLTQLKVFPEGHERFDDILMSALVMERRRTTAGLGDVVTAPTPSSPRLNYMRHANSRSTGDAQMSGGSGGGRRQWHYDATTHVDQLHYL